MHDKEAHSKPIEELLSDFETRLKRGLTQVQAQERLAKFGANELTERPRSGFLALLWDQFKKFLVIILRIAAAISLAPGEYVDSVAILFIVMLNAVVGVFQEAKTQTKHLSSALGLQVIYFYCPIMKRRGVTPSLC